MTAVGITEQIVVIIAAMTIAMVVMLVFSGMIARSISTHPTLKMLVLSFLMMIGVFLAAEDAGFHMPKGYLYFGMAFALGIEVPNMLARRKRTK